MSAPVTSLFVVEEPGVVVPTELATGPWSRDSLHGGPVAALLAHELEQAPTAGPMHPARLTVELLRPVGHEPMTVVVEPVRTGRKVQVVEARLHRTPEVPPSADTLVARGTVQQIRRTELDLPADVHAPNGDEIGLPDPESLGGVDPSFLDDEAVAFHHAAVEHRSTDPFFRVAGPAIDWVRVHVDLLPGVPPSPFARVAAACDFGNGISGILPFGRWLYVNPDLSVFLTRLPVDDWVGLRAVTRVDEGGVGLAECEVWDRAGRIGRSVQTLLIDRLG